MRCPRKPLVSPCALSTHFHRCPTYYKNLIVCVCDINAKSESSVVTYIISLALGLFEKVSRHFGRLFSDLLSGYIWNELTWRQVWKFSLSRVGGSIKNEHMKVLNCINKEKKIKTHHFAGPAAARPAAATRAAPMSSAFCRAEWSSAFFRSARELKCSIGGLPETHLYISATRKKTRFYFKNFTSLFQKLIALVVGISHFMVLIFSCSNGRNRRPSVVSRWDTKGAESQE